MHNIADIKVIDPITAHIWWISIRIILASREEVMSDAQSISHVHFEAFSFIRL